MLAIKWLEHKDSRKFKVPPLEEPLEAPLEALRRVREEYSYCRRV